MNKFNIGDWVVWRGTGAQVVHTPVLFGQSEYTIRFSVNTRTGTIVKEENVLEDELKAQKEG